MMAFKKKSENYKMNTSPYRQPAETMVEVSIDRSIRQKALRYVIAFIGVRDLFIFGQYLPESQITAQKHQAWK